MSLVFFNRRTGAGIVTAVLALAAVSVCATEPPNKRDLSQGTWILQPDKSNFCGLETPKQSIREIVEAGWGLVSVHWTGLHSNGSPFETWYVYRYDGENYPADIGKPANESITWKLVSPSRVEFTHWSKDGKVTQRLARIISDNGQLMTQTTRYVGHKPEGCVVSQVFIRR